MSALFIDSDNALGSPSGDVDDGFAVSALLLSGAPIAGLASIFGNTSEALAFRNHASLARLCGYGGPILRGAAGKRDPGCEAADFLSELRDPTTVLALGPLTNLALALKKRPALGDVVKEVVMVATNFTVRLPAFRFVDFNQWSDPRAMREVLSSSLAVTIVPCDVARKLRIDEARLAEFPGPLGDYLREHCRRWLLRARRWKGVDSFPAWDLVAAAYALEPRHFETEASTLKLGRFGGAAYGGSSGRAVRIVRRFSPNDIWESLLSRTRLLNYRQARN